jgi:predicted Zn-dependent protease
LLEFTERATEWTTQAKTLTLKIRMILEEKIGQTILNAEEKINLAKQITKKLFEKDDRPLDVIIAREKSFLTQQADKIRKEVQSSENNLAFFGNNASAKLLLKDVNQKLDKDKAVLASLEAQIQQLSKMQRQFK